MERARDCHYVLLHVSKQLHAEHARRVDADRSAGRSEDRSTSRDATDGAVAAAAATTATVTATTARAAETGVAAATGGAVGAASGCPSRQEAVASKKAFRVLRKASKKSAQVRLSKKNVAATWVG